MNKKLFRFITASIISISVIACNLPNNSTKSNSKLDSTLNKLSDSNTTDSEISHDSDKLSKALSKDKNFFTRENKNSFKTLANHNDIECNPSGLATPEDCTCEDSPNTLPDTSLPLTPESMGALNNELDIAKSPEAKELEDFHSNLGKIHELENGVNQINAYLAQDKKDKAELEKQKNNPNAFSTQSVKNNNKDKASKDKSDPRPHDCKATNPLDCFNTIDEKLAYLDKHIKFLEAKLLKEQTKLTSAQTKQDELFNKIDTSYRPYLISTGKKIREAARALNAKLYPRVNLFSTSNHNKRMDRLELFFNSSKLDFDFYVSAKNTYEMSKAGSVIGREFYIFDDMVYLFIRDGLTNADPTKYNVLASIKKYTRQIEEHLKQYKKENKKLIEYINKLKAQINSQGFRVQAESQAVADYNAATNSKPCPVPSPSPSPSGSPSSSPDPSPSPSSSDEPESCGCEINNSGFTIKGDNCGPNSSVGGLCKSYCEPQKQPASVLFDVDYAHPTIKNDDYALIAVYDDRHGPDLTFVIAPTIKTVKYYVKLDPKTNKPIDQRKKDANDEYLDMRNGNFVFDGNSGVKIFSGNDTKNNLLDVPNCNDNGNCEEDLSRKDSGVGNGNSFKSVPKNGFLGDTDFQKETSKSVLPYYESTKNAENYNTYDLYSSFVVSVDLRTVWNQFNGFQTGSCKKIPKRTAPEKISIKLSPNAQALEFNVSLDIANNIWKIEPIQ